MRTKHSDLYKRYQEKHQEDPDQMLAILYGYYDRVILPKEPQQPSEFADDVLTRDDEPPYITPRDSAGYDPRKYPSWIGRDSSRVKCKNCLHWERKDWYCLIKKKRTHPKRYWCFEFITRM